MPDKLRDKVNPTQVEEYAPGKFRLKKAVSDTAAQDDLQALHTLVKDWEDAGTLPDAEFRALVKRSLLALLRAVIWLATRQKRGEA